MHITRNIQQFFAATFCLIPLFVLMAMDSITSGILFKQMTLGFENRMLSLKIGKQSLSLNIMMQIFQI